MTDSWNAFADMLRAERDQMRVLNTVALELTNALVQNDAEAVALAERKLEVEQSRHHAVFVRRETEDAARVAHQHRSRRILVAAPEFFDDHHVRFGRGEHGAEFGVKLSQAALERGGGVGRDHAGLE